MFFENAFRKPSANRIWRQHNQRGAAQHIHRGMLLLRKGMSRRHNKFECVVIENRGVQIGIALGEITDTNVNQPIFDLRVDL
ncbi:hypothetical protein D3C76_1592430 [compost metagenome]